MVARNYLALAAVVVPLVSAGTATMEITDATTNIKGVFLDFDKTIIVDGMSEEVRQVACNDAEYPECDCGESCDDDTIMIDAFNSGGFTVEDLLESFGGSDRLDDIYSTFTRLSSEGVLVHVVSTSWYPITAEQWVTYLTFVFESIGMPVGEEHEIKSIIGVADPGPGLSADKGSEIQAVMTASNMAFDEAIFADDSSGNIESAVDVCNTLYLTQRVGLDDTDRAYIETLAFADFPLLEDTQGTMYVEVLHEDSACGERTYLGKAATALQCGQMVVDSDCMNDGYFMYRDANAACNCLGDFSWKCDDDLHPVSGIHVYSINYGESECDKMAASSTEFCALCIASTTMRIFCPDQCGECVTEA